MIDMSFYMKIYQTASFSFNFSVLCIFNITRLYFACSAPLPFLDAFFLATLAPADRICSLGKFYGQNLPPTQFLLFHDFFRFLNDWTYLRLQLLFDASNILMETTLGAFSTQTGWVVLIILTRIHRLLWLVFGFSWSFAHSYSLMVCPTFLY